MKYNALTVTEDAQKQMITADVEVSATARRSRGMYPAAGSIAAREDEPTTEVALRRGFAEDLYIVLAGYDVGTQTRDVRSPRQPAGQLDLVRRRHHGHRHDHRAAARAGVRVRDQPRARGGGDDDGAAPARWRSALQSGAQRIAPADAVIVARSALERDLETEIICMCGGCRLPAGTCGMPNCHGNAAQIAQAQGAGRRRARRATRSSALRPRVRQPGSAGAPIDRGFNRLAWLLPYAVGLVGIVLVGGIAGALDARGHERPTRPPSRRAAGDASDLEDAWTMSSGTSTDATRQRPRLRLSTLALLPAAVDGRGDVGRHRVAATRIRPRCCCFERADRRRRARRHRASPRAHRASSATASAPRRR